MSPMIRAARSTMPLLIVLCSCSARLFAAPLITHPLGVSAVAKSLLDAASGGNRFWLSSSAGTAGVHNGPQSVDGFVGAAGGSAPDQGSARTGMATAGTEGTGQYANTGPVGQVTNQPDGFAPLAAKDRLGPTIPSDLATHTRAQATDQAATNRASPGQVSSAAAPLPAPAVSSPAVSSQQAATPVAQSGSISSSQTSQSVSNSPGTASATQSAPLNPAATLAPLGAGTPVTGSSSTAPSGSAGATAAAATAQSSGSTPPASGAGLASAPSAGSSLPASVSGAAPNPPGAGTPAPGSSSAAPSSSAGPAGSAWCWLESSFQRPHGHPIACIFCFVYTVDGAGASAHAVRSTCIPCSRHCEREWCFKCGRPPRGAVLDLSVAEPDQHAGRRGQYGRDDKQSGFIHERHERPRAR